MPLNSWSTLADDFLKPFDYYHDYIVIDGLS